MSYERAKQVIAELPDADAFVDRVATFLDHDTEFLPCPEVLSAWIDAIKELYEQNTPHTLPDEPPDKTTIEHARWRDLINALNVKPDIDMMFAAVVHTFKEFTDALPPAARVSYSQLNQEQSGFTVPLYEIANVLKLIDLLMFQLLVVHIDKPIFPKFHDQFFRNCERIAGKPFKSTADVPTPAKYKGDSPLDFLRGTPLESIFHARVPIYFPEEQRFAGHWIVAPSGQGKTNLLLNMIVKDLDQALIIMDSKGELTRKVSEWKKIKDRLVVIDPRQPIALNPFNIRRDNHTIALLEYVISSVLEANITPKQRSLFRPVIRATLCYSDASIERFDNILDNGADATFLPADLQKFFQREFREYSDTRRELHWRLRLLMENPHIARIFSSKTTKLNLPDLVNENKIVVINNATDDFGEEGAEFIGRYFIALILEMARSRSKIPEYRKKPVYVYIDECHNVIRRDTKIPQIIDECRSQKVALILAHQRVKHLEHHVLDAVANCAIRMANSDEDTGFFASSLRLPKERLSLKRGAFATFIRNVGSFVIEVPLAPEQEKMTPEEQLEVQNGMEKYYEHTVTPQNIVPHSTDNMSTDASEDW